MQRQRSPLLISLILSHIRLFVLRLFHKLTVDKIVHIQTLSQHFPAIKEPTDQVKHMDTLSYAETIFNNIFDIEL